MSIVYKNPFQWLQDIEELAREKARGLPHREVVEKIWRGLGFRLNDAYLVTPLIEVREVLKCPDTLARVPGAKPWVKGIANIRGQLLPIIDLQACLGGDTTLIETTSRMLVIHQGGVTAGILVDEVLGIKLFPEQLLEREPEYPESWYREFVRGMFVQADESWTIFDMHALSKSRRFLDAAI